MGWLSRFPLAPKLIESFIIVVCLAGTVLTRVSIALRLMSGDVRRSALWPRASQSCKKYQAPL